MPSRRTLLLLAALAPAAALAQAADPAAASRYIATLAEDAFKTLIGEMSADERARRLRSFLQRNLDLPGLPQATMGRYWDRLTPTQRSEYLQLFESYLVVAYAPQFAQYPPQGKVTVTGAQAVDGGGVVVNSESVEPGAQPVKVDWLVVPRQGGWRIADVVAAGISARETLKADFTGLVRQNGGNVEALLAALRKKTSG
jgi:phospholipid transport system substrate-binding protein